MRVLITRASGERLARRLRRLGHEPVLAPLLEIAYHPTCPPLPAGTAALLVTSAHGIGAFAELSPRRDLPVLAVGSATAAAARRAGFALVATAGGDAASLAALVRRRLDPGAGPLVHLRGEATAVDLAATLADSGYRACERILYAARPCRRLPPALRRRLARGPVDVVLFHSARAAAALAGPGRLPAGLAAATAIAISPRVAAVVARAGFRTVLTAARPREDAMLACLRDRRARRTGITTPGRSHAWPAAARMIGTGSGLPGRARPPAARGCAAVPARGGFRAAWAAARFAATPRPGAASRPAGAGVQNDQG